MRDRSTCVLWLWDQSEYRMEENTGPEWRQYDLVFPRLQQSNIDIISLECHGSRVPFEVLERVRGKNYGGCD